MAPVRRVRCPASLAGTFPSLGKPWGAVSPAGEAAWPFCLLDTNQQRRVYL